MLRKYILGCLKCFYILVYGENPKDYPRIIGWGGRIMGVNKWIIRIIQKRVIGWGPEDKRRFLILNVS